MAFRSNDRVKETSTSTGTGNLTLAGAVSGFQAFSIFANNDTFFYAAVHQSAAEWEVGMGTYVSATPAIARTTIMESSNADAAVNFSAGTKDVFVTRPSHCFGPMRSLGVDLGAPEAFWQQFYLRNDGKGQRIFTRDEYGLYDILGRRNMEARRRSFAVRQGSDTLTAATDWYCKGMVFAAAEGTIGNTAGAADGPAKNLLTAATLDADAGVLPNSFTHTRLDQNPDITVKFRVNSTAARRVWIGLVEADHMASDSTAGTHKFALRLSTTPAVTGFTIVHSNGTNETVEAQIQASDTNIHTIRLIGDNANTRWGYSFDGAAIVWISSNIPAATALMGLQCEIRTTETVAKNMDLWFIEGTADL